jgi:hypothetical protein
MEVAMRAIVQTFLFGCAIPVLACHDSDQSPAEALAPDFEVASGNKDRVSGAGSVFPGATQAFKVNAQSGPLGENPKGHLTISSGGFADADNGDVTCLLVVGNRAIVGTDDPNSTVGRGSYIAVVDNSAVPGGAPDGAVIISGPHADEAGCALAFSVLGTATLPLQEGRVKVDDAIPSVP